MTAMIPLMILLIFLGVYPQPIFDLISPALSNLYSTSVNQIPWIGGLK
jgi:NADH:ubiquinone oxidoreductase subunit 4 (subunit M)